MRRLTGRSHVTSVPARRDRSEATGRLQARLSALLTLTWQQAALAVVGVLQVAVATAQGFGVDVGLPAGGHGAAMGGHLMNESTAWSLALGVVMIGAAFRPSVAIGLAAVLTVFTVVLAGYVISDAASGAVTISRALSHLPVLAAAVLALLVWRDVRLIGPEPQSDAAPISDDIILPDHASRGHGKRHLHPTDGSAA